MTTALIVSTTLLWILLLAGMVGIFALARQVGLLHQRIAPAGALAISGGVKDGATVPDLKLKGLSGEDIQLLDFKDKGRAVLIMFVSPDCSICKGLLPAIKSIKTKEQGWLDIMLASDGPAKDHHTYIEQQNLKGWTYVLSRELGMTFEVGKLPFGVLIDQEGKLVAKGLTNSREHIESLFEAQRLGVPSIQAFLKNQQPAAIEAAE